MLLAKGTDRRRQKVVQEENIEEGSRCSRECYTELDDHCDHIVMPFFLGEIPLSAHANRGNTVSREVINYTCPATHY